MNDRSWEQRAVLGEILAQSLDGPEDEEQVLRLVLDPEDTAVTLRVATALLERRDVRGVRLLVRADAVADPSTSDWVGDALTDFRARARGADDGFLRSALIAVSGEADPTGAAAVRLLAWLGLD